MNCRIFAILFIFFLIGAIMFDCSSLSQSKLTEVEIINGFIELGTIKLSDRTEMLFYIRNVGQHDLNVIDIAPDCKCTLVGLFDRGPISPGDTLKVRIFFRPNGSGYFQQSAEIKLNTEQKSYLLVYRGQVL